MASTTESAAEWIVRGEQSALSDRLPPVVTQVSIPTGATGIPPGRCTLRVTFSEAMTDASWSVVEFASDTMPAVAGAPRLEAGGTVLALEVVLEPGRIYAFWLNNGVHSNFRDLSGVPLVPYLVGFQTAEGGR